MKALLGEEEVIVTSTDISFQEWFENDPRPCVVQDPGGEDRLLVIPAPVDGDSRDSTLILELSSGVRIELPLVLLGAAYVAVVPDDFALGVSDIRGATLHVDSEYDIEPSERPSLGGPFIHAKFIGKFHDGEDVARFSPKLEGSLNGVEESRNEWLEPVHLGGVELTFAADPGTLVAVAASPNATAEAVEGVFGPQGAQTFSAMLFDHMMFRCTGDSTWHREREFDMQMPLHVFNSSQVLARVAWAQAHSPWVRAHGVGYCRESWEASLQIELASAFSSLSDVLPVGDTVSKICLSNILDEDDVQYLLAAGRWTVQPAEGINLLVSETVFERKNREESEQWHEELLRAVSIEVPDQAPMQTTEETPVLAGVGRGAAPDEPATERVFAEPALLPLLLPNTRALLPTMSVTTINGRTIVSLSVHASTERAQRALEREFMLGVAQGGYFTNFLEATVASEDGQVVLKADITDVPDLDADLFWIQEGHMSQITRFTAETEHTTPLPKCIGGLLCEIPEGIR